MASDASFIRRHRSLSREERASVSPIDPLRDISWETILIGVSLPSSFSLAIPCTFTDNNYVDM